MLISATDFKFLLTSLMCARLLPDFLATYLGGGGWGQDVEMYLEGYHSRTPSVYPDHMCLIFKTGNILRTLSQFSL